MIYFEFIFAFCFLFLCIFPIIKALQTLKINHLFKISFSAITKKFSSGDYIPYYHLHKIISFLYLKKEKKALVSLCAGKPNQALNVLKKHKQHFLALVLTALIKQNNALAEFEKFVRQNPKNKAAIAELALLFYLFGNKNKMLLCLNNLEHKGKKNYTLALTFFLQAIADADEGDLFSASIHANKSVLIFRKLKAFWEEAQVYSFLGVIYRTAIMTDVSQLMFDTALKIFKSIKFSAGEAAILGNFGMLMAIQKRYDEADDYYHKAALIFSQNKLQSKLAEILNQKALLYLMKDDFAASQNFALQALQIHMDKNNPSGIAFSKEILAQIAWNLKNWNEALQLAFEAKNIYFSLDNFSAFYENIYLMALAYFELKKFDEAEKELRLITKNAYTHQSNFHVANAYNLLGLIYLKKNDLKRAKGLFKQSLDLEIVNNRFSGIATDYTNISLIEFETGNVEQALKTINLALEYAKTQQDSELTMLIEKQLNKMSKTQNDI